MGKEVSTEIKAKTVRTPAPRKSLVEKFGARYSIEPDRLLAALKATAFHTGKEVTHEQMLALLVVADQYRLNPFTKELYAFPDEKRGGIVPVVSVDGWIRIINERPELGSIEFEYAPDDADDAWISCTIRRKDRDKPLTVREYMSECRRETGPWKSHPRRMLRHKTLIQAARIAFGFAGIYDPDEAERIANATAITGTATDVTGKPAIGGKVSAPEPEGFEPWLDNLRAVADEGVGVLEDVFSKAPPEFRAFLTVERPQSWETIKERAAAAKASA